MKTFMFFALALALIVAGVGGFALVVYAHRKEKQQPPQVVYIQAPEYYQPLPAGHAMVVYPARSEKVRDYVQQ